MDFLYKNVYAKKMKKAQTSYFVIILPGYFYTSYDCVSSW